MSVASNIKAGRAYVEVTAETSALQRSLASAQAKLRDFGKTCTGVGKDLLVLSGSLAVPFAAALKSFAGFDDRMRLVQAVTSATDDEFAALTKTAQRLGRETSFTAQQVADGMTAMGRMGFKPDEIEQAIGAVLNLSRATGTELAESADIAANALRIYGLEAGKMATVSDILAANANGSAQTLTDLFEGLKMVGPQAKAAGENITDTCAALGVLANVGIKGSLAGTALRKSFSQFAKVRVRDQLAALGVATVDTNGNLRKTAEIMADIAKVMARMPSAEKLAFAEDIFDVRGSLAGLSLGGNIEELDAFIARLKDVDGMADATARKMDEGLGGSFRLLMSAAEGAMNAIGDSVNATLQPLAAKVTSVINAITKWIESNSGLVTAAAAAIAGVAGLGAALVVIGTVCKAAAGGIALLSGTLHAVSAAQSALVSQGSALASSLRLIVQSFADYRNAAIPAMVGTSRLLAALNLPIDSRAKQIAASFALMGNAEAAAAAKAMLATKLQAVCAAMKSLNAATVLATVSTKAHAASLAVCAAGTKLLTAARTLAAAVCGLFSAANLKAAATATASAGANVLLAATAKAVAGGYLLASAAAAAFCALPVTWVLVGIAAAVGGLVAALSSASKHTAELSEEMAGLREKGDALRKSDDLRMQRLQQLAEKQSLTNVEMAEAGKLANALQGKYGDLGIGIDKMSNRLTMAADAQKRFNEAMKKATLAQVDAEIAELCNNLAELAKENDSLTGGWVNAWNTITFRPGKAADDIAANGDKAEVEMKKLAAAQSRRRAIAGNAKGSLTGEDEDSVLASSVQTEATRRAGDKSAADEAAQKASAIEKRLSRESRTELENEISDIRELRDEYKSLIATMLEYERSKSSADTETIAELEGKLAQADADAERRVNIARKKAQDVLDGEVSGLRRSFDDQAADIERQRSQRDTDRTVDKTLETDAAAGMKLLSGLIGQAKLSAQAAKAEFAKAMDEAKADGGISDEERVRIRKAQDAYTLAESLVDKYAGKLQSAQDGTRKAADSAAAPTGNFYAKAMEAMGGKEVQLRAALAAEAVANNTKRTNDLLRKNASSGALTFA